jgi:hypothetical protein
MGTGTEQSQSNAAVREALKRACVADGDETVVFHLRAKGSEAPPTPVETGQMAESIIKKAAGLSGHTPKHKTVFRNLGAMAVQGNPEMLLKILDQPEVFAASMNRPQAGSIELIHPVRKTTAKGKGWVDVSE